MPRSRLPTRRWFVLGRLLPREVRTRIFEPAYNDLLREWLASGEEAPPWRFGVRALGILGGSAGVGVRRALLRRERIATVLKLVAGLVTLIAILLVVLLRDWIAYVVTHG